MELNRPVAVTAATWAALACSAICLVGFGILSVTFLIARDDFVDAVRDRAADDAQLSDVDPGTVANVAIAVTVAFAVWCLAAMAVSLLAMRRSRLGRWLLTLSAVVSSLFSLIGTFAFGIPVVFLIVAVAVVVMLFTPSANDWYAERGRFKPDLPIGTTQPWG